MGRLPREPSSLQGRCIEFLSSSASPESTVPEMQQLDFSEAPWDEAAGFALTKYPSYEIDWDSLLAAN